MPATLRADSIILDNGGVENDDGNFVLTNAATRGITLTANGGFIGCGYTVAGFVINGPITGPGFLGINFENSPVTLNNPANDYAGGTVVGTNGPGANPLTCTLKLGQSEVLPDGVGRGGLKVGADSSFYNTIPSSTLDLNGKTETVNTVLSGPRATIADSSVGGGRLIVGRLGGDSDYRGAMTGASTLEKRGGGTLRLTGAALSGGTVEVKEGTVLAGGPNLAAGSTVLFNGGDMTLTAPSGMYEFYGTGGAAINLAAPLTYSGWRLWPEKACTTSTSVFPNGRQYVYRGRWLVPNGGTYSFSKGFNDGGYLAIDGSVLISNMVTSALVVTNNVALTAGWHSIELRVCDNGGTLGPQFGFSSGVLYDPTNGTFSTAAQIAGAKMFTDDGGTNLVADGYNNVLAGRLVLATNATLTVDGVAGQMIFAGIVTTNTVTDPEPVLTVANGGTPLLFGSTGTYPATLDASVSSAGGMILTNRVWLRRLPSGSYSIAPGSDLALDGTALLGDSALNLANYSVRVVRSDSVGGDGSVTANSGTTVWFDTMQFSNNTLADSASTALTYANSVSLNSGTVGFTGAGTMTYSGIITGTGTAVKSGNGDLLLTGTGSSLSGEIRINAGRLLPASEAALAGATVRVSGGWLVNPTGEDLTLNATPVLAQDGGIEVTSAGEKMTINSSVTGVNPISKRGNGTLTLGGTAMNANLQLYVRAGALELAKSGAATNYAVLNLLGIQSNTAVRLTGSNGNQIGGNVVLDGGALDLNGISETIGVLTNTLSVSSVVTNGGSQAATLTVGEGDVSSFFSGRLSDGASPLVFDKTGLGTLTLTSESIAYTGGTRVDGGTLRIQRENSMTAQLLRFSPLATRTSGDYVNTGYQLSEFQVMLGGVGLTNPAGTTAYASVPAIGNEMGAKAVDGSVSTKWYCNTYGIPLIITFGQPVTFNSYRWATAADASGRDPITWTLEVGVPGAGVTNWYMLDAQTNYNPTTSRNTWIGTNFVVYTPFNNVIPDNHPVSVAAGSRLALSNLKETIENLSGNGSLLLENNSVITLTDVNSFTGSVVGAGTLVLKTAGGNSPGFTVRDIGVTVRNDGAADTAFLYNSSATNLFCGSVQDGAKKLGIEQTGSGTTSFSGTNSTYTGQTRVLAGVASVNGASYAKYVRFSPTLMRGGSQFEYQISDFDLMFGGQRVAYPVGTVASTPNPLFANYKEGPTNTLDGNVNTKFYSSVTPVSPLVIALPEIVSFDGYRWFTANDSANRDPVSWTVETSADGSNWTVIDVRTNQTITSTRFALAGAYDVPVVSNMNVFSDVSLTTVAAPGVLGVSRTSETIGPLSSNGTVRLSIAATLGINAFSNAAFSGGITGTGTVVKTGAATQALSGSLAFSGTIIVANGVLDLDGAVLTGVTNIVIKSGATLTGAATVNGDLTLTFEAGGLYSGSLAVTGALTVVGPVKFALPSDATYPFYRTVFSYASADATTLDALAAAVKPSPLPTGHAATVRVTSTSVRLIVAPTGMIIRVL